MASPLGGIGGRLERIVSGRHVLLAALGLMIWAVVMFTASGRLDVAHLVHEGKKVGYRDCVNWTFSFALVGPLVLVAVAACLHELRVVLRSLVGAGMVLGRQGDVLESPESVLKAWRSWFARGLTIWLGLVLVGTLLNFDEWRDASFEPTRFASLQELRSWEVTRSLRANPTRSAADAPELVERDWSIATVLRGTPEERTKLLAFTFVAWSMQAALIASVLLLLVVACCIGGFILSLGLGRGGLRLVPDPRAADRRRGFERFERLGSTLLLSGMILYVLAYITILHNAYLRDASARDIVAFLAEPIRAGIASEIASNWQAISGLDFSTLHAMLLALVTIVVVLLAVPCAMLGLAARDARERLLALDLSEREATRRYGMTSDQARKSVADMDAWPFSWIRLNGVLVASVACVGSLLFFRLLPYVFGVALLAAATRIILRTKSWIAAEPQET